MCVAPCRLYSYTYSLPACNGSSIAGFLQGDFSSSAEFFVCVGVFGFLYCTATLILYLGYQSVYRQSTRGPMIVSSHLQQVKPVLTFSICQGSDWENTLVEWQKKFTAFFLLIYIFHLLQKYKPHSELLLPMFRVSDEDFFFLRCMIIIAVL